MLYAMGRLEKVPFFQHSIQMNRSTKLSLIVPACLKVLFTFGISIDLICDAWQQNIPYVGSHLCLISRNQSIINSQNSGPGPSRPNTIEVVPSSIISEQRNRTSVPYQNLTQSNRNNTVLEPLILYLNIALSTGVGSLLTSDIEPPNLKRLEWQWRYYKTSVGW